MRNFQTGLFFLFFILLSSVTYAQVSNYSFSTSTSTFAPITGGTVVVSATDPAPGGNDSAAIEDFTYAEQALPFPFWFGTSYQNSFRVNSNGWMGFGSASTNTSTPVSSTISFNGIIAPIAFDLMGLSSTTGAITSGSNIITGVANTSLVKTGAVITGTGIPAGTTITGFTANTITLSANATSTTATALLTWTTGEIRTELTGTAPNREFVIQFTGMSRYNTSTTGAGLNSTLNFQIRLREGGGNPASQSVQVVYGNVLHPNGSTTVQSGLRGTTNTDYNNRTSTTDWSATTAGGSNSATITLSSTVFPATGLTFTWTPPALCNTPSAQPTALSLTPSVAAIGGSFTAASPSSTGYLVVRTTTNVAPVPVDLTYYSPGNSSIGYIESYGPSTTFNSTGLAPVTTYYYWVFSFNSTTCSGGPLYQLTSPLSGNTTTSGCSLTGTKTIPGDYPSLSAAFADLEAKGMIGPVILELQAGYTGAGETYPIRIPLISCASAVNHITVRPAAGATGLTITSSNTTATIDMNGAQYVTIDGRPGGTGTSPDLKIINTSTSGVALRMINDAQFNTVTYCDIQGQNTSTTSSALSGVVYIGTADAAGQQGNDNNTISFSNIHGTATGTPAIAVSVFGSTTNEGTYNDGGIITGNNIYDYFIAGSASTGIKLDAGTNAWTISNNNFYQTSSRNFTSGNTHRAMWINSNSGSIATTASGFVVTGNTIGGTAPGAGGSAYTLGGAFANVFMAMDLSVGLGTPTSVQNNTIRNFAISTTSGAGFIGISQSNGHVNMGTVGGNIIGVTTGTASISVTTTATGGGLVTGYRATGGTGTTVNIANNHFGGITTNGTATLGVSIMGIQVSGGTNINVTNNTIGSTTTANSINASSVTTGNTQSVTGISVTSGTTTLMSGNTIANMNNNYTGTGAGVTRGIIVSSSASSIQNNVIRNLSSSSLTTGSAGSTAVAGIVMSSTNAAGVNVTGNSVYALSLTASSTTAATQITGLYFSGTSSVSNQVNQNFIHSFELSAANNNSIMTGIDLASGVAVLSNNMIRLGIRTDGTSLTQGLTLRGISSNSTSGAIGIYFNSIYLGGTGVVSSTNNTFAFIRTATSGNYDIRNNILVNSRSVTTGTAKQYALYFTTSATGATPDYNIYHTPGAGGVFAYNGFGDVVSYVPGWVPGDIHSLSVDPLFVNPSGTSASVDLHLQTGSVAEGTGTEIAGITEDYDGQIRSTLSPTDIGADAGQFGLAGVDVGISLLVSPQDNTCVTSTQTVVVKLKNFSTNTIDFATYNVTVTATASGPVTYNSNIVISSGTLAPGATMDVTLPATIDMSANGTYVFNATTTAASDLNGFNNAINPETRIIFVLQAGTYNVGAGQSAGGGFNTLTSAIAAYNTASCFTGPVVFQLTDAAYGVNESFPLTIQNNTAVGTNTLTIRPASGVSPVISGSNSGGILVLNGADHIILEGSNSAGTTRDVTVSNTYSGGSSAAIIIRSLGTGNGAVNNVIRNTIVSAGANSSNYTGILIGGATVVSSGDDNDNNTIQNNLITKAYYGIYASATPTGVNDNLVITGNTIGSTTTGNTIGLTGIYLAQANNALISRNEVFGITQTSSLDAVNINAGVTNSVVSFNRIHDIVNNGTNRATGIALNAGSNSNISVHNNMVYGLINNGTGSATTFPAAGIYLASGGGYGIYYNTVSLTGDRDAVASTKPSTPSAALMVLSGVSDIDLRNNILVNTQTAATNDVKSYAIYSAAAASAYATIDHNDYFVSGPQGIAGYLGSAQATLAAIQSAFGQNVNSKNIEPVFVSPSDLHLDLTANAALDNLGTPVSGISLDIDGDVRNATTPDMGADEFTTITGVDLGIKGLVNPIEKNCYGTSETVTVTLKNYSANNHNFALLPVTISAAASGANNQTFTPVVINTGILAGGDTLNVQVSANYDMSALGTYTFTSSSTVLADADLTNNAMASVSRTLTAVVAGSITSNVASICQSGTPVLSLTGHNGIVQWQEATNAAGPWTNVGTNSNSYIPAAPISSNTFYQAVVGCNSSNVLTNMVQVIVNNPQVLTNTPNARCGVGTVVLQASGTPGTTLRWYAGATGGSVLASGTSFTTPVINTTTTYYVSAENSTPPATVGTGASSSTSAPYSPFNGTYGGMKGQYLFTAAELTAAGLMPGNITSIGLDLATAGSTLSGLAVQMGHTSLTGFATPVNIQGGLTTVANPSAFVPVVGNNTIQFNSPFAWDGVSNLLVSISWSNSNTSNTASSVRYDATPNYSSQSYRKDNEIAANLLAFSGSTGSGTSTFDRSQNRPKMTFGNIEYCASTRVPVVATVNQPPAVTMLPNSVAICQGQPATLVVTSANNGYSYSWSPGSLTGSSITVTPAVTTDYIVTATDNSGGANNGCVILDTITVTVNTLPGTLILTPASATVCSNSIQQLTASGALVSYTTSLNSATLNLNIPDNSSTGIKDSLQVSGIPAGATIDSVIVGFNISHEFAGDVEVSLEAPNGQIINLVADRGGSSTAGFVSTRISSNTSLAAVSSGSAPFTGTFRADATAAGSLIGSPAVTTQNFSNLFTTANGYWKIRVNDDANSDVGSLVNWSIKLDYKAMAPITWTPQAGLFTDAAATVPYTGGPASSVYVKTTSASSYTATATSSFGCTTTATAAISITPAPAITTQPVNQIGCTGGTASFSVGASGAGLTYQWQLNGVSISGATGATLNLTGLNSTQAGNYTVVISGTCLPSVTSSAATLSIGDNSWVGISNTDWNNPLNWCGGVPTATTNVLIPSGTPFSPVIAANADVNNLVVNSGATLTVTSSGRLRSNGNLTNNGNFNSTAGTLEFMGAANQTVPSLTAAYVIMNGTGGITLGGNMNIGTALTLTNGNIFLGNNNLVMTGGSVGNVASHIVTNGTGRVTNNNINTISVVFPIGPTTTSYNPVIIVNGQGRNYTVGVATGVNPGIANSGVAVNRTWNITPSTAPVTPVTITLQYADADANAAPAASKFVGVHNGTAWQIITPAAGILPSGGTADRQVQFQTISFGPMVMANQGGITFPTALPNVDADVSSVLLLPNLVNDQTLLRVQARRSMEIDWIVTDANGRIVMAFSNKVYSGQNDLPLRLGHLAGGVYQITGKTDRGKTTIVRFVRM
jgi:subtilisin-like proprotein convertase family protein